MMHSVHIRERKLLIRLLSTHPIGDGGSSSREPTPSKTNPPRKNKI